MKTNKKTSRVLIAICIGLFIFNSAYSQSETHDFITYDTLVPYYTGSTTKWMVRISRPRNLFTAGHADTASRPCIFSMPGQGEVGTNAGYLTRYGPHYWLNNGWDGSVQLGNGTHYPIIITICQGAQFTNPRYLSTLMDMLVSKYHIKAKGVHVAGLSWGAFLFGDLICFSAFTGDEHAMSRVTSYVGLSGQGNTFDGNNTGFNYPGFTAYSIWAQKYGGKFFGIEGYMDDRGTYNVRDAMESTSPGSAYFSYNKDGGGSHCCWNNIYNPNNKDWQCVAPITSPYNTTAARPNSMGTYKKGSNIFQWMLRQGDTSLVGSNMAPIANPGPDVTVLYPQTTATLDAGSSVDPDGTIVGYSWNKLAGPTQIAMANTNTASLSVSNLTIGTYTFELTVTDNMGATSNSVVSLLSTMSILAIDFQNVKAQNIAGVNKISWQADDDDGLFYIERSFDGKNFVQIADIKAVTGTGTKHSYSYSDDNTAVGKSYYRIKNVSASGAIKYSEIVQAVQQGQRSTISFYPNPVKNYVDVQVSTNEKGAVIIRLLDLQGRVVMQKQGVKTKEVYIEKMNIAQLPNGVFIATCMIGNKEMSLGKIIKN